MIPYQFKESDITDFSKFVGIQCTKRGEEYIFKRCPYCKGGGTRGKVDHDTFAINAITGAFNCKRNGCGVTGNMLTLSKDFDFSLGTTADEYFRPRKRFRVLPTPEKPYVPKEPAVRYLESRGISEETAKRYEITVQDKHEDVLVFPFYDEKGRLQFVKYRKIGYKKGDPGSKEWCQEKCKPILFGMKQCNTENKALVVCEGQLDSLSVAECGIGNAVSVPTGAKGFTWIPYCWDWLQGFETIIVFGDHENGHITLLDEFSRRFGKRIKHVREEDYKDCKDANEILCKYGKEQVRQCVENAVSVPVKQVIDLSQVEDVDIFKIEKLKTGIRQIDRLLYGGLPFGGVHLLTGKSGEGKSTLASQILIQARYQGYKCFAYSGELPNYLFKAWMNSQVAGRRCAIEFQNRDLEFCGYTISQNNRKLIDDWYRDQIYLYDNSALDGEEMTGLLKIIEQVIQQYGVKVILLDNLMTAMIMDAAKGSDQYERQTDFVNKLRVIALRYNVMVILIAHMRKNNFSQNGNDEIAGSSNISNIAMITMSYERKQEFSENQRVVKVMKNRLFGRVNMDGFLVDYDEKSRRIYGQGDNIDFDYGFDPQSSEYDEFLPLPDDIQF